MMLGLTHHNQPIGLATAQQPCLRDQLALAMQIDYHIIAARLGGIAHSGHHLQKKRVGNRLPGLMAQRNHQPQRLAGLAA